MNERAQRQIPLPEVGFEGQKKIECSRILMVGAGGLGSPALLYLAAAGVGTSEGGSLGVIDGDSIEASNLGRQVLYRNSQKGLLKAETAKANLKESYPDVEIRSVSEFLSPKNALSLISDFDLILDGTDTLQAKSIINSAAGIAGKPVIFASVTGMEGQLLRSYPGKTPCYRCVFPDLRETGNCNTWGVLGPVAGLMGTLLATEALRWVLNDLEPKAPGVGELFSWDARNGELLRFRAGIRPECPACAPGPNRFAFSGGSHPSTPDFLEGILIDVREIEEWRQGSLPHAIHLPLSAIQAGTLLPPQTDRTLFLFCKSGKRAQIAKTLLNSKGWKNIETLGDLL